MSTAPRLPLSLLSEDRALRESWRLLEAPALWVIVLVIAPLVALISWYAYRSESLPGRVRAILMGLRTVALCLLLLVLFRPVRVRSQENVQAPEVLILIDDSASMRNRDAYEGEPEIANAIRGLVGTEPKQATRLDVARSSLETNVLGLLDAGGYEPRLYAFHEDLSPVTRLDNLSGRGRGTHVGDALGQALNAHRGRHVTDVIVVSDGRSNGGALIEEAALLARAVGAPVHTIVVGDTRPERNLVVELVEVPTSVLEGDEVVIAVRVHGRGVGLGSASVLLEELDSDDGARTLASETIDLEHTGERIVLVAPAGSGQGDASQRRFRVSVPPLPEERILDDNTLIARVHVAREKIRVLYVEAHPRYEYRFLKDLLIRADERIEAQIYLASATPGFPQEASPGLPRLVRVPTERRELLDNYDVVLLGDINPYSVSPDPAEGEEFVQSLFEFVERGGGLGVIAGEYENPRALAGTEFARLLPVKLDPTSGLGFGGATVNEHRPTLESPGNPHEIVRLHPDLEMNRELWEEPTGLRGYYWYFPVVGAKPGAQILLRHPQQPLTGSSERDPLLVIGYHPSGRTLFLATDDCTWRWRYRYVHRYHERFWRNAIRWLALGRLREGDRRYALEPLRSRFDLDERVVLEARVLDEDFQPSTAPSQKARLQGPEGSPQDIELVAVPGRPGRFRADLRPDQPGRFQAWMELNGERIAGAEFEVVLPSRENADPSPDPVALQTLARLTGGLALSATDTTGLAEAFPGNEERREPISSELRDAWDHWGTLLLALGVLCAEWILRKRHELI